MNAPFSLCNHCGASLSQEELMFDDDGNDRDDDNTCPYCGGDVTFVNPKWND